MLEKLSVIPALFLALSFALTGCVGFAPAPSAIKDLGTPNVNPGAFTNVVEGSPDAVNLGVFTVPSGQVLVIRSVQIHPVSPGSGRLDVQLGQNIAGTSRAREAWNVTNSEPTVFEYPSGLVIASGSTLIIKNNSGSAGPVHVAINGYLATD